MSLLKRFKPVSGSLPTAEWIGLAVHSANHAVNMLEKEPSSVRTTYAYNFTAEDRATVGKYAAENGVAKAQRYFKIHSWTYIMIILSTVTAT